MKATGIVRRIDDLGRVVIPKEIRRTLRIREGTPLEIFTDREGEIILKKYSPIGELGAFAGQYAESLAQTTGLTVCVCDRDQVIAVSGGSRKELLGKNISRQLETVIEDRENILVDNKEYKYIQITDNDREDFTGEAVSPILCEGGCHRRGGDLKQGTQAAAGRDGTEAGHFCRRVPGKTDGAVIIKTPHLDRKICSDAALF